jgi:hypothetical protein
VITKRIRRLSDKADVHALRLPAEHAVPQSFRRRKASWEPDDRPELPTGQAVHGRHRLLMLAEHLVRAGIPGIGTSCGHQTYPAEPAGTRS